MAVRVLVMLVLVGVLAVTIGAIMRAAGNRDRAAADLSGFSAPTLPPPAAKVVVIGDALLLDEAARAVGTSWTQQLMIRLPVKVDSLASRSAGFVSSGKQQSFEQLAEKTPSDAAVVVVVAGSREDPAASAATTTTAVESTLREVSRRAPAAAVILVGPFERRAGRPTTAEASLRTALADTEHTRATIIDPERAGWFAQGSSLLGSGGTSLTDATKKSLLDNMAALVSKVL